MTEYGFTSTKKPPVSSLPVFKEAKEKRRKQLEAVFQRRRENYKRYYEKIRLQAAESADTL